MIRSCLSAIFVVIVFCLSSHAQEVREAGEPFRVEATHDGIDVTSFDLVQDGSVVQSADVSELDAVTPGAISFAFPSGIATPGDYVFQINTIGPGGSVPNLPVTLTIQEPTPDPPDPAGPTTIVDF